MSTEQQKSILIIEDELPIAHALELKFSNNGFNAKIVFNGEEALDSLKKEKFDIILSDLVMPKMDGFRLLEELKKNNNKIPIAILSNLSQEKDKRRAKELDAIGFFVKSDISIAEIVTFVEKLFK